MRGRRDETKYQAAEHEQDGIPDVDPSGQRDERDTDGQQRDDEVYPWHVIGSLGR